LSFVNLWFLFKYITEQSKFILLTFDNTMAEITFTFFLLKGSLLPRLHFTIWSYGRCCLFFYYSRSCLFYNL